MCGIAGKVSVNERVDPLLVERMCEVIEHRGPDSRGTFFDDGVGLGIQRLAIIDLETGDQPICNEDGSVVVVLNGEIYNYRELRAQLESPRPPLLHPQSDTEVIVHLYEDHGDACVEHLRGMFAFALWDRRRRRLLLARDRVGKKPLFYAEGGGALWFGSEAKVDPSGPRGAARRRSRRDRLLPSATSTSRTPERLRGAAQAAAGAHPGLGGRAARRLRRYWKLAYEPEADRSTHEDEMHELIRSELLEATRLRLRSDVPLGAFLSGGVDSSAVVAAMAQQSSSHRSRPSRSGSTSVSSTRRATRGRSPSSSAPSTTSSAFEPDAIEVLPQLVWHYGEPFADHSAIPSFYLAELTRRHVTVALNGDGGDENFAGYTRYWGNEVVARLDRLPGFLARLGERVVERTGTGPRRNSRELACERLFSALQMSPAARYAMWMAYFTEAEREALYTAGVPRELGDALGARGDRGAVQGLRRAIAGRPAARRRRPDLPAGRPAGEDGHRHDGPLARGALAAARPRVHGDRGRTPRLGEAARHDDEEGLQGRAAPVAAGPHPRPQEDGLRRSDRRWFRGALRDLPGEILLDPRSLERGYFREDRVRSIIDRHLRAPRTTRTRSGRCCSSSCGCARTSTPTPAPVTLSVA